MSSKYAVNTVFAGVHFLAEVLDKKINQAKTGLAQWRLLNGIRRITGISCHYWMYKTWAGLIYHWFFSIEQTLPLYCYLLCWGLWVSGCGRHRGDSCRCPVPAESVWWSHFFSSPGSSFSLQGGCKWARHLLRLANVVEWSGIQPKTRKYNTKKFNKK